MPGDETTRTTKKRDRAVIVGELAEKKGLAVLRQRGEDAPVEAGVVRGVREGEPITGELVNLKPTAEDPRVCDVEVLHDARPAAAAAHAGPARVASEAYRSGWDALFGGQPPTGGDLN
ncbi:MAG: hypothetical protein HYV09_37915 [Deltaproteobacteria bacterium]|nr:hypothetical protein [Deltaproteobacteria bacterium]